jgi:phage regulator Rha-like protein
MKTNIVEIKGQQVFTTSLVIAERCDNRSHAVTLKLIRKYQEDFEEFGEVNFQSLLSDSDLKTESKRQKGGSPLTI